jgi:hypothetical protein
MIDEWFYTLENKIYDLEGTQLESKSTIPFKRAWLDGYLACLRLAGIAGEAKCLYFCKRLSLAEEALIRRMGPGTYRVEL